MNLLYPIGLLVLAGLIIPVLLHLWNVKQGKTLKIGSIALLGENSTSSSRSLKITDWLLFILRCLIVILLAFVLAQPFFKKTITHTKNSGWILVDRNDFLTVYNTNKPTIDSLVNLGFELRDFNLGFNQFFLKDSLVNTAKTNGLSYSALLRQLNKQIPAGYSAYLFADHQLKNFDGDLPKLSFNLIWKEFKQSDTVKVWPTKFLDKSFEGKSTPNATNYTANQSQNLPVVKVAIYDPTGTDAKYIKAALAAISDFTNRKIEVKNWNSSLTNADVIFWLSEQPFNSTLKAGVSLFTYQKGKILKVNSSLNLGEELNQNIELFQRIAFDQLKGNAIWTDGFGVPVLIKKREAELNHFYFYSRFNPNWGDLVWNEQFTRAIIPIVLDNQNTEEFGYEHHPADQRAMDQQQLIEAKINKSTLSTSTTNQELDHILWFLAFLVLFIERILSFSKKTEHVKS
ncbi:BatA domain-containing protein [Pedobacter frigiditerrae]|uniref:BatA domain-containing protein n=1 Tax=Pedobacter frigiditerrae TaxID=2530452 RepID=UPI00293025C7|nr:BatA domain-containing protein [Pedobacter frigiditerrae]